LGKSICLEASKDIPLKPPVPVKPIPPSTKTKQTEVLKSQETEETLLLSNQQLSRLVMLEQLKLIRLKLKRFADEAPATKTRKLRHSSPENPDSDY